MRHLLYHGNCRSLTNPTGISTSIRVPFLSIGAIKDSFHSNGIRTSPLISRGKKVNAFVRASSSSLKRIGRSSPGSAAFLLLSGRVLDLAFASVGESIRSCGRRTNYVGAQPATLLLEPFRPTVLSLLSVMNGLSISIVHDFINRRWPPTSVAYKLKQCRNST